MKALIVEDEIMAMKNLVRLISENFPDMEIVGTTTSVRNTISWLKAYQDKADIIFMDVELADGVCFEIFRQVDVKAKVIMTTAYDNYAIKAFEAGSVDYLLKPVEADALRRAVGRCRPVSGDIDFTMLLAKVSSAETKYKERYIIKLNDRIIPLPTADIAYIYSEDKNNYLVTKDRKKYVIDSSLDEIFSALDPQLFFRISRGCVISMKSITSVVKQAGGRLKVIAEPAPVFEMTVSRSRVDDFLLWLEK